MSFLHKNVVINLPIEYKALNEASIASLSVKVGLFKTTVTYYHKKIDGSSKSIEYFLFPGESLDLTHNVSLKTEIGY